MSDLLAKCDWHGDELRVELPQWPEVVTVWVNGKAMPYAPVVADVRSLQAENDKLRKERDMYSDLVGMMDHPDINAQLKAENAKLRDQLEEQKCFAADLERDVRALRELVRDMWSEGMCECGSLGKCANCIYDYPSRMRELGVEL